MDWLIFGSINIIILVVMFLFLSRRLRRQYNASQFLAEVQQEVNAIVTELNQTTERNIQLLEDRIDRVKALVADLDKRIVLQESEERKRSQTDRTYHHLKEQRRAILRDLQAAAPLAGVSAASPAIAPASLAAAEPAAARHEASAAPAPAPVAGEAAPMPAAPTMGLHRAYSREALRAQVVEWSRAGMAPSLIAQQSGLSLGEVDLIISLHSPNQP
jgi:hypothetical protein